ncbi:MAG: PAS domain-containing protein [Bacteroidales bacterium]|nr:PAS domain-containing protein [Bacteroidales bacterium]
MNWAEYLPLPLTICDAEGTIIYMNPASLESFNKDGGGDLIGSNLLDCHPEPSKSQLKKMLEDQTGHTYSVEKNGKKKLIHEVPWYKDGKFAGLIELSIKIPEELKEIKK